VNLANKLCKTTFSKFSVKSSIAKPLSDHLSDLSTHSQHSLTNARPFPPTCQNMAISSSLTKVWPCLPTLSRDGHFLQPCQDIAVSSSLTKAWPFPPVSPRNDHFLQPHEGMSMSSSLTKALPLPPVSPRNDHFLQPQEGMTISSSLTKAWRCPPNSRGVDISSKLCKPLECSIHTRNHLMQRPCRTRYW